MRRVAAFAPGTVANLGPGLDVLGLAVSGAGDTVTVERGVDRRIRIRSSGHPDVPTDPDRNTAGIAAARVREMAGAMATGLEVMVEKGLPLSGGQGGSAASAVAAAVATNELLGSPFRREDLLEPCVKAEETVSGRHADNVAAALFGGVILVSSLDPAVATALLFPEDLLVVLAQPQQLLSTREARSVLPASIARDVALAQAGRVGALVAALATRDWELLRRAVEDRIAEPARAPLLPGFAEAKAAALEAGALGCSISGSGPSAFAFAVGSESALRIGEAMVRGYRSRKVEARSRVCSIDARGARVVGSDE
ncbi:MAG TPA: homoserine kinase [Thermoanaerobaculia bacterium]|nr:homoserine kinase [Thermoanaerobaculia bacterium]